MNINININIYTKNTDTDTLHTSLMNYMDHKFNPMVQESI